MKPFIKSIVLENDKLLIIDQRFLPHEEKIIELKDERDVFEAISTLAVRGAPAIGITAAYGVYISLLKNKNLDKTQFKQKAIDIIQYLKKSRPTAYDLFYALYRMEKIIEGEKNVSDWLLDLKKEALKIHNEDLERSERISINGLNVIPYGAKILTHCNTGGLATGGNGTALSIVFKAFQEKRDIFVYVDETRPLLQGARLTAWELFRVGVPCKLICDSMAAYLMAKGWIDLVLVGADRIALNGDFANKIGTYSLAVLAHYHGIPFYTVAPYSTFDFNIDNGDSIPIEERNPSEVKRFGNCVTAPESVDAYNPAFDVTPHRLLTGIITEAGIIYPPFKENILALNREKENGFN